MPIKTHIARLCATTALAALFIGAPLSATRDLSGKPQIIGAAAQAQAVEEEPDFSGPGPSDLPSGDPGLDDPDTNGDVSEAASSDDVPYHPSTPFPDLDGPDQPDESAGPVMPVTPTPAVARLATNGGNRDSAPQAAFQKPPARVRAQATETLTAEQEKVSAFAESLDCADTCTIKVLPDGTILVAINADRTRSGGSIEYRSNGMRLAVGSEERFSSIGAARDQAAAEARLRAIIRSYKAK